MPFLNIFISEFLMLKELVLRKVKKGYNLGEIADALDYNKEEIESIYNLIREENREYTVQSSERAETTGAK